MDEIESKERVLKTLKGEQADRVPFLELLVDTGFSDQLLKKGIGGTRSTQNRFNDLPVLTVPCQGRTYEETRKLLSVLKLDAIGMSFWIKHLGVGGEIDGRQIFTGSQISTVDDVRSIRFPDPNDSSLYEPLKIFIDEMQGTGKALYCMHNNHEKSELLYESCTRNSSLYCLHCFFNDGCLLQENKQ